MSRRLWLRLLVGLNPSLGIIVSVAQEVLRKQVLCFFLRSALVYLCHHESRDKTESGLLFTRKHVRVQTKDLMKTPHPVAQTEHCFSHPQSIDNVVGSASCRLLRKHEHKEQQEDNEPHYFNYSQIVQMSPRDGHRLVLSVDLFTDRCPVATSGNVIGFA